MDREFKWRGSATYILSVCFLAYLAYEFAYGFVVEVFSGG
jgi:hypothetical protein